MLLLLLLSLIVILHVNISNSCFVETCCAVMYRSCLIETGFNPKSVPSAENAVIICVHVLCASLHRCYCG